MLVGLIAFLLHSNNIVRGGHDFPLKVLLVGEDVSIFDFKISVLVIQSCDMDLLLVAKLLKLILLGVVCLFLVIKLPLVPLFFLIHLFLVVVMDFVYLSLLQLDLRLLLMPDIFGTGKLIA